MTPDLNMPLASVTPAAGVKAKSDPSEGSIRNLTGPPAMGLPAFVNSLETGATPSQLQELAKAVGVDLTAQLASVRKEINPGG